MAGYAGFGSPSVGAPLSITVNVRDFGVERLTDRITGFFRGGTFQNTLGEVNEKAAYAIQNAMLQSLNASIKGTGRAQRSTQYLVKAVASNKFRDVKVNGFTVGVEHFLNSSPVRLYYRRIDEGDPREISGTILFTNDRGGKLYGPWSPTGASGGRSSNAPPGYKHAFMPMYMARGVQVDDIGPWPAYNYFAAGARTFQRMSMASRYREALAGIGLAMSDVKASPVSAG